MASDRTVFGGLAALAILALIVSTGGGDIPFLSAADDDGETGDIPSNIMGEPAELVVEASQLGSSSSVTTTAVAEMSDGNTRSTEISGTYTWDVFTVGETIDSLYGVNESAYYPIAQSSITMDSKRKTVSDLKVADQASTGDIDVTARDDGDSIDSVTMAAGEELTLDSLRFRVENQDDYFNGHMVVVEYASDNNASIQEWQGAEEVAVPDSTSGDEAYIVYDASQGTTPNGEPFSEVDSDQLTLEADDSNNPSETITFKVKDLQVFEDANGDYSYGVEDEDENDLGVSDKSYSFTVN